MFTQKNLLKNKQEENYDNPILVNKIELRLTNENE